MPDSVRKKIVADVKTVLAGITGIEVVTGIQKPQGKAIRFVTAVVLIGDTNIDEGARTNKAYIYKLNISIVCYVRQVSSDEDLDDEIHDVHALVQQTIMNDPTRGGNAITTDLAGDSIFVTEGAHPVGGFIQRIEVQYKVPVGDPFSSG